MDRIDLTDFTSTPSSSGQIMAMDPQYAAPLTAGAAHSTDALPLPSLAGIPVDRPISNGNGNGNGNAPAARRAAAAAPATGRAAARTSGMSYKFQRLREKLREAITGGEFNGK